MSGDKSLQAPPAPVPLLNPHVASPDVAQNKLKIHSISRGSFVQAHIPVILGGPSTHMKPSAVESCIWHPKVVRGVRETPTHRFQIPMKTATRLYFLCFLAI